MFFFLMQRHRFGLFYLDLAELKSSSFLMSMVSFVTFQSVPFFKGIDKRLGRIYMFPSWKFMLEYMISFLEHLNIFTLLFGHVYYEKMSLKFYLCWCPKLSSINLCLFGDMRSVVQQQVSSHAQFITIWKTWTKFTLLLEVYLMGIMIKHCSLMMSLVRPFKIQNEAKFSLNHSEDMNYPKTRCNG